MIRAAAANLALVASILVGAPNAEASPRTEVAVIVVDGLSLPELLEIPQVRGLAIAGGAALMSHGRGLDSILASADSQLELLVTDLGAAPRGEGRGAYLDSLALLLDGVGSIESYAGYKQVWVLSRSDGRTGIGAVIVSAPSFETSPIQRALTSDSTRRDGVVVAEDIAPTMRSLGGLDPGDGSGEVIHVTDVAPPTDMYVRYRAMRRMSVPIQTAAGIYVTAIGLLAVALLALRRRIPGWALAAGSWAAISVVPLSVMLLMAGHLPTLSYRTVVPFLVAGTLGTTLAVIPIARSKGTLAAAAALGLGAILALVIESGLGWTAALTPFLGGSELDGGRFYGMPNVEIGLLLGASMYLVSRIENTWAGVGLLMAAGLFAGLPHTGANLGGSVTLFAGAGFWFAIRRQDLNPARRLAGAATLGVAGVAAALAGNRFLPGPDTHIANFVRGRGAGLWATFLDRLEIGLNLIADNPFALVPVLGVPAVLAVVLKPPASVKAAFASEPGWRDAILATLLASVVAYLANDSGAAALGLGFGTALAGLLFVSLRDRAWMMEDA